jgi:hypothetical protein
MKSIVTITRLTDIEQVKLQLNSIELFIVDPITHYIIIQDLSDLTFWNSHLNNIYTKHTLKILPTMLPASEYHSTERCGYRNQQLLKLLAHALIDDEKYLVLDSKNFFIRHQSLKDWPTNDGRPIIQDVIADGDRQEWIDAVAEYIGVPKISKTYEILTPFVMHKKIAKKCCEYDIVMMFNEMSKPLGYWDSEFLFYSLIAKSFFNKITDNDLIGQPDLTKADTYYLTTDDLTQKKLDMIHSVPGNLCSAVHRNVIPDMSETQKNVLINWLISKGFNPEFSKSFLYQYAHKTYDINN